MALLRTTGWWGVLAAFSWLGCSGRSFPIGTDALQGEGGADGGSSGASDGGSAGTGGTAGGSSGSGSGGTGGSGAGVGTGVTCDAERQALVELIVSNKSCSDSADCRTHFVGCGVTEDDCTGAVFTNGSVDESDIGPMRTDLETCVAANEGQVGCAGCERAARGPGCVDGLCIGGANCALEAGVVWDFIARNAACEVDDDCTREFVGGQVTQDGCTSAVYLNGDFDQTTFASLRDQYFACDGGQGSCFLPLRAPACNSGFCGSGSPDPTPLEPVADCGERQAIASSCSFEDTCDQSRCGLPWSGFDERGCLRPTCTSSDDCGAGERCVAPPLLGDFACEVDFSVDGAYCTGYADGTCECETPAACDPVAYCLPSAFYPEESDCNLGTLDCAGLEAAERALGHWLNDDRVPASDTHNALVSCRKKIVESGGSCDGIGFMSECVRNQDGRLPLFTLCGENPEACPRSLSDYLEQVGSVCSNALSTTKRSGCGIVRTDDQGGTWGASHIFDAATGALVGVSFQNDVPNGPCNVSGYRYGFVPVEACEAVEECTLCVTAAFGEPADLCP